MYILPVFFYYFLDKSEENEECRSKLLRSETSSFDYASNCVFCGNQIGKLKKVIEKNIRQVSKKIKLSILDICKGSSEMYLQNIEYRLLNLNTSNGRYHLKCYAAFKSRRPTKGRPTNLELNKHFLELCYYIDNSVECQFTLEELKLKLKEIANINEYIYSNKYLKQKLFDHYGNTVHCSHFGGKKSVFSFVEKVSEFLSKNWNENSKKSLNLDRIQIVEAAAKIIKEDIQAEVFDLTEYPSLEDIKNGGENLVPQTLKIFTEKLTKTREDTMNMERKRLFINHNIMTACRPRSFLSPIHLGLSVYIYRKYGSKNLIQLLNKLGVCSSYSEVNKFIKCAVEFSDIQVDEGI